MNNKSVLRRNIGGALAFLLPVLLFLSLSLRDGSLADIGADAECYLSVADNFLATGHFIQTVRPFDDLVVPFGLPLILTAFRALGMSVEAIAAVQHLMVGASCLLLYLAEKNSCGRGGFAPAAFCLALLRTDISPENIYVEIYYLFFLCLILWLLSREDMPLPRRLLWLNIAGFCVFVVRLVLLLVWLPILAYTLWCVAKKRFPLRRALILGAVFAGLLLGNAANNRREAGHWVWMENYSGNDMYLANNPCTQTRHFTSSLTDSFADEEYFDIRNDWHIDQTQRDQAFNAAARRWIVQNPGQFAKNTLVKFWRLFLSHWLYGSLAALAWMCLELLSGGGNGDREAGA